MDNVIFIYTYAYVSSESILHRLQLLQYFIVLYSTFVNQAYKMQFCKLGLMKYYNVLKQL